MKSEAAVGQVWRKGSRYVRVSRIESGIATVRACSASGVPDAGGYAGRITLRGLRAEWQLEANDAK